MAQSRLGGLGAQWRQYSRLGKSVVIVFGIFFLLAILWGTGTVDVDYVRNQFKGPDNHGGEPIQETKDETPIIDGVPNDKNDRPIPNGVIEEAGGKQANGNKGDGKPAPGEKNGDLPVQNQNEPVKDEEPIKDEEPVKVTIPDESLEKDLPKPAPTTSAVPSSQYSSTPIADNKPAKPVIQPLAGGAPLRVMFIGASMTLGDPRQSAYRMRLREWMVALGNKVNFVGTARFGHFKDNDVQAFAATPIQILHEKAMDAVPDMQPNLVIINAGSSDCFQERHWGSAHGFDYTRNLVDFLFEAAPTTTVILSTLVTSPNPAFERCIKSINAQIRQVAVDVEREGKHIFLSEQHYDQGIPDRVLPEDIKEDNMHPTFEGWEKMAEIFKQDILEVDAKGWIEAPVKNDIMDDGDAERDLEDAEEEQQTAEEQEMAKADGGKNTRAHTRRLRRGRMH
ncbi:hypothetical protein F4808DRAFT_298469 [Astrocystis sublimbata]|nr:hypothetical protein F4808DRAFT_298469 [Astrocystis sublimbata]